jgi:selenocysteine-specific translation elongation factor
MADLTIGKVSDFFAKPVVAGIDLSSPLKLGDKIHIKGHTTDVTLTVESMQIKNVNVQKAKAGDSVGVKVPQPVRKGDIVYQTVVD